MEWALQQCPSLFEKKALDIGAGIGRWSRWLAQKGATVVSGDITVTMLQHAVQSGRVRNPVHSDATSLPFRPEAFDLVVSVTVIQHIPHDGQASALKEIARVCCTGGYAVMLELIDQEDFAPHVFPRAKDWWIGESAKQGLELVAWRGQEFLPLEQLLRRLTNRPMGSREEPPPVYASSAQPLRSQIVRHGFWSIRGATYMAEALWRIILPPHLARHGVFVFRKVAA